MLKKADFLTHSRVLLVSLLIQTGVGYADYATGEELHLDVFYFIPISITAWYLQRGDVLISAIVGALTWGYADIRGGHHYSNIAYWYWNILVSFGSLLILGLAVKALRENLKKKDQALTNLQKSTEEVQKLQNQLQVICAWTKRIRVEGEWMTIEEFLQKHLHLKLSHGISPEAFSQLTEEDHEKSESGKTETPQ